MTTSTLKTEDAGPHAISRSVQVAAPVADVFALLVDPHRHPELDGSGTLPYKITSKVTAVEENQLVEWQHPLGHRWRWELAEVSPGTTKVTETFDYATVKIPFVIELTGFQKKNANGIESTLQNLVDRFDDHN
jgi:uncharacterized protein YndB with AHSA1/START domain